MANVEFPRWEISEETERAEIKGEKSAEAGLAEASRKIDTSGGGTITRVTQAVSGGRHDGFKYFRPEARAPACPGWNYRSCSLHAEIESDVDVHASACSSEKRPFCSDFST